MLEEETPPIVKLAKGIENDTSICVKCGLCLEHCPTYLRTRNENESPRGRIALLEAVANEQLAATHTLQEHVDHCLTCRACETACPAHVPYGNIIDAGRTLLQQKKVARKLPLSVRFMHYIVRKPKRMQQFNWLLWLSQKLGLRQTARFLGLPTLFGAAHLDRMLPQVGKPIALEGEYPALTKTKKGTVGLFLGCMHSLADQKPLIDCIDLLTLLGFDVIVPPKQQCCGAMFRHDGIIDTALNMAQDNVKRFQLDDLDYITYLPSGCGCELKSYKQILMRSKLATKATQFSDKVIDILSLINKTNSLEGVRLVGFDQRKTAFVHTPCTIKHHLRQADPAIALLKKLPNLNVVPFETHTCCGAAGTHMIKHPEIALDYISPYLYELSSVQANFIVSSNIGCAMHFRQGLKAFNKAILVLHPVSLLAAAVKGKKNG